MKIGDRIRMRREQLKMSQEELAFKLGYKSRSSINKIENDASGLPQSKIVSIAKALETTPAYLMGWEETESDAKQKLLKLWDSASESQQQRILDIMEYVLSQGG